MATNMMMQAEDEAAGEGEYQCPLATSDVKTNLKNRNWAFANVGYGPANPLDEKNNEVFWLRKAVIWATVLDEARGMRCGNCAAFIQTPFMLDCIKAGIEASNPREESGYDDDVIETAQLGFCELFHFKCAGTRTCDAWLVGGPITKEDEDKSDEYE
jgi:hypothetical protein